MICTLKNTMRYELEEFDLLPMNRADYRHSWTYSFSDRSWHNHGKVMEFYFLFSVGMLQWADWVYTVCQNCLSENLGSLRYASRNANSSDPVKTAPGRAAVVSLHYLPRPDCHRTYGQRQMRDYAVTVSFLLTGISNLFTPANLSGLYLYRFP